MTIGVLFALSADDESKLLKCSDEDRLALINEDIEERYSGEFCCDTDKSWDAIHRAFNNSLLTYDFSETLQGVILGGEPLYGDSGYIISYKTSADVERVSKALSDVNEQDFRIRYFAIQEEEYGVDLSEDDFSYSWSNVVDLIEFYNVAAAAKRCVIFTAAQ